MLIFNLIYKFYFNIFVLFLGCGGTFNATSGTIFSPGYPNNYQHNLTCDYVIVAAPNQYVVLKFDDSNFRIEGNSIYNNLCFTISRTWLVVD